MGNTSADKLIDHIIMDARSAADKVLSGAVSACDGIRLERDNQIAENSSEQQKKREIQVREILDGASTRARLEGRKELLAAKRDILDQTFADVYRTLCSQSPEQLASLYARFIRSEAGEGDILIPSQADREAVEKAVSICGLKNQVSAETAPFEHGFLLKGNSYEKDCSLKAILNELRTGEETKVAEVLFSKG